MEVQVGSRWKSAVCDTEVIVVKAASGIQLECGGAPMLATDAERPDGVQLDEKFSEGTQLGKRYGDEGETLELLCIKGGQGSLAVGGVALLRKEPKTLPASD